jgi:hypothetical protein
MTIAKHILTVYNKYMAGGQPPSPPTEAWNRTVIRFGQWEDSTDRNMTQTGITNIDKHIYIIIPKTAKTGGKRFIPSIDWAKLTTAEKLLTWTVNADDIIALGETPEITSGYSMSTLRAANRACLVKSIENYFNQPIMPHIEVIGI